MKRFGRNVTSASLMVALICAGCHSRPTKYRGTQLVALDISNQGKSQLNFIGNVGYDVQRRAPNDVRVKAYVFAHTFEIAYDASPLKSRGKYNAAIGGRLNKPSKEMHIPDTRTDVVLTEFSLLDVSLPTEIILVTDGGIESLSPEVIKAVKEAIRKLAANRNVTRFLLLGVQQEHRKRWESWTLPFGNRGHVYGTNDYREGLESIGRFGK